MKNNILSAPVRDAESSALVGIFTYRVLLKALLARAAKHRRPEEFNMSDLLVQLGPKEPVSTIIAGTEVSKLPVHSTTSYIFIIGSAYLVIALSEPIELTARF